jgi:hypothetical protein
MTTKLGDSGINKKHNSNSMEVLTMAMRTMAIRQLQYKTIANDCCRVPWQKPANFILVLIQKL